MTDRCDDVLARFEAMMASARASAATDEDRLLDGERAAAAERAARQRDAEALTNAGVPERQRRVLADLRDTPAVLSVREWQASDHCALVLSGGVGTGKSIAAAAWLLETVRSLPSGLRSRRWWKAFDLCRLGQFADELGDLCRVRSLVIDDLGGEYADKSGSFATTLTWLVDARYEHNRRIVMTTNLEAAAFRARYGERIYDRLRECGAWVAVGGPSMRGATR
jgi:DNA replication protein DnaC